ncbi:unnamed protein product [Schistocephalus solidus]|uniref:Secreted protein n=1 Tax=Schistocephalus solidus TaxID=70667 RepID=A0A183T494_SCHSO|nr:unnamed protein product [Schistocephalus solidus]
MCPKSHFQCGSLLPRSTLPPTRVALACQALRYSRLTTSAHACDSISVLRCRDADCYLSLPRLVTAAQTCTESVALSPLSTALL